MIYCMYAINQVSTYGLPYAIPHRMGNQVQTKNPERGCPGVFENETSRGKKILSGLGVYRDRDSGRAPAFAYGDSAEILSKYGGGDVEEKHLSGAKPEVSFSQECLLG